MSRTTEKMTYVDGSYFCNVCDGDHEAEGQAEECFDECTAAANSLQTALDQAEADLGRVPDFITYGDMNGLTKLEVLLALESVVLDHGLYDQAKKKLDEMIAETMHDESD